MISDRLVSNEVHRIPLLVRAAFIRVQLSENGTATFTIAPKEAGDDVISRLFLGDLQRLFDANGVSYLKLFGRMHAVDALLAPGQASRASFWLDEARKIACDPPTAVH